MVKVVRARKKGVGKVTFTLPPVDAATVCVMGDFNGWRSVHAMERTRAGGWRLTLELERGRRYEYRYLLDGTAWICDPDAAESVANPYGGENSAFTS